MGPQIAWSVVDRTVHVSHRRVLDVANSQVMAKLMHDERTVLARVIDPRRHDPDAAPSGERYVVSPVRVPWLELVGPIQLFDDEITSARAKADAPPGTLLPDVHRFVDESALLGVEARINRVDDWVFAFACARSRVAYRGARADSERAN